MILTSWTTAQSSVATESMPEASLVARPATTPKRQALVKRMPPDQLRLR